MVSDGSIIACPLLTASNGHVRVRMECTRLGYTPMRSGCRNGACPSAPCRASTRAVTPHSEESEAPAAAVAVGAGRHPAGARRHRVDGVDDDRVPAVVQLRGRHRRHVWRRRRHRQGPPHASPRRAPGGRRRDVRHDDPLHLLCAAFSPSSDSIVVCSSSLRWSLCVSHLLVGCLVQSCWGYEVLVSGFACQRACVQ